MIPTVIVHGTFGYTGTPLDAAAWWYPGSGFWREGAAHGVRFVGQGDPFEWAAGVAGVGLPRWLRHLVSVKPSRRFTLWKASAQALRWHCTAHGIKEVNLLAHSHGGQVAAYLAHRRTAVPTVRTLVTAAMPRRRDMAPVYAGAAARVGRWVALEGGRDRMWGIAGRIGDGALGAAPFPARVERVVEPDAGHTSILDPARWTARGWWAWLAG